MKCGLNLWAFFLLVIFGCSNESQNARKNGPLNKSIFSDEWYFRATLVEKQSHSSLAFTGMECPVERVKFEITKNRLLAFRSYELGTNQAPSDRKQNLVAAFAINRHLDENSDKKSWYERQFIDVDWSRNLVPHLECNQWLEAISITNLDNNTIVDPSNPYKLRTSDNYIEATVAALVQPDTNTCNQIGDPNCAPSNYRVKFSFRKVDKDNDYEKRHYPDFESIRYGKNEQGFCMDTEVGCKDSKELWLYSDAQRREVICDPLKDNISDCFRPGIKLNAQFGFFRTEVQNYDRQEGFQKGRQQLINRHNIWQKSKDQQGQLIPLNERMPKKIIYYLNPGFPTDLLPAIKRVSSEWNIALANVVAKLKDKNSPEDAIAAYGDFFEIRVNDCNVDNVINYQHQHGLENILQKQGLSSLNDDTVEQACSILEWVSLQQGLEPFKWQQLGDLRYNFVNGVSRPQGVDLLGYGPSGVDPKTGEIISGNANIYLAAITSYATNAVLLMEKMNKLSGKMSTAQDVDLETITNLADFNIYVDKARRSMNKRNYLSPKRSLYQRENFAKASFGDTNSSQATQNIAKILSKNISVPEGEVSSIIAMVAAAAGEDSATINIANAKRTNFFSQRSACFMQSSQLPYVRLRDELKSLSFQEKIDFIKARIVKSVLIHEIGHTFGLRHNYKGAKDPLNYSPNFWGVDTNDYRARKGLSEDELKSASIMDYHKHFNSDFSGLGLYDYAALLSGYGEKIEIFDEDQEDFVPKTLVDHLELMHYRDLPFIFSGHGAEQKIIQHIDSVRDKYRQGDSSAKIEIQNLSLAKRPENFYKRRVIDFQLLKQNMFKKHFGANTRDFSVVPYAFCTDGQIDSDDIFCRPFIEGSSASEVIGGAIEEYERAHALEKIGIKVLPNNVAAYLNHIYARVYVPILRAYQKMYALNDDETSIYPAIQDLRLSSKRGLDLISRVLQSVEPGIYCKDEQARFVPRIKGEPCVDPIKIDSQTGDVYRSSFGEGIGASTSNVGFIYDKIMALIALIDDQARISHEFSTLQEQNYSIGLYRIFTPQLMKIFSSIYTDKWTDIAPTVSIDANKKVKIIYQDLFSTKATHSLAASKIKPSNSSIFKDYAILFSMAGLTNLSDHKLDFAERSHISLIGANSAPMMDDTAEHIVLGDPNTGVRYRAFVSGSTDLSLGYLLLKDASQFISDGRQAGEQPGPWYLAKTRWREISDRLNTMHSLASFSETPPITREEAEAELLVAKKVFEEKNRILKEKIRTIDMVRALSNKLLN
jgi:hypothetical protein